MDGFIEYVRGLRTETSKWLMMPDLSVSRQGPSTPAHMDERVLPEFKVLQTGGPSTLYCTKAAPWKPIKNANSPALVLDSEAVGGAGPRFQADCCKVLFQCVQPSPISAAQSAPSCVSAIMADIL